MVKVNLKTIGQEKNSADLLSVFVQQTLATASPWQRSQVQILSHPPLILEFNNLNPSTYLSFGDIILLMKKNRLTISQLKEYNEKGYLAPIDILSSEKIKEIQQEIENIEKKWPDEINGLNRNNIHYYSSIFDKLVHNSKILDVIENFIGPNILVAGSVLFLKEPENKGFISWHQDGLYQGWKPYNSITAWLAITDVNEENGCMRMWPGSHKK